MFGEGEDGNEEMSQGTQEKAAKNRREGATVVVFIRVMRLPGVSTKKRPRYIANGPVVLLG